MYLYRNYSAEQTPQIFVACIGIYRAMLQACVCNAPSCQVKVKVRPRVKIKQNIFSPYHKIQGANP